MRANEFVKKHGWVKAKTHLAIMDAENWHNEFFNDLQNLVNAYEFVQAHGSVSIAKKYVLKMTNGDFSGHYKKLWSYCELVESCT